MSLDVYLKTEKKFKKKHSGIFIRENGATVEITEAEWKERFPDREPVRVNLDEIETDYVYDANITHNLTKMADKAGIYEALWRPEEIKVKKAKQLIPLLEKGLGKLKAKPAYFKKLNPENGWGSYDGLVNFVEDYLNACREYPQAKVSASR